MHDMFNMDGASKFHFDLKDLVKSGLSVKDAIAPTAFAFKSSRTFQMGGIFCAASFLSITASDISDQLLKDVLDMDSSQIVTMHIQSVNQNRAIKTVKRTITELDRSKIEEQKKAIRAGYDIDIIPSDLATYGRDAKALLKELQSQNERMFLVTFLVPVSYTHLDVYKRQALGFQGFLILICVAIYAVLIQSVAISGDAINSIWSIVGYTVLLLSLIHI